MAKEHSNPQAWKDSVAWSGARQIELEPVCPRIGAEVRGVDLSIPLDQPTYLGLRQALLEWKVIFFRDQDITLEQQLAFGRQFGALETHPFTKNNAERPEVMEIYNDAKEPASQNVWHTDVMWREEPSLGSILRAVEIPTVGGDTVFADMSAAYENLPDEMKAKIDGRVGVNDTMAYRAAMIARGDTPEEMADYDRLYPPMEHPLVRTHPETGQKVLYAARPFTRIIKGMSQADSDTILEYLFSQASTPEYQCRFRWKKNSIAFWDNRVCQHYAVSDYFPAVRKMERVTIAGDRPF